MVVIGAAGRYAISVSFLFCQTEQTRHPKLEAITAIQFSAKESFKLPGVHNGGIGGPEEVVNHPLPKGEVKGQSGGKLPLLDPPEIGGDGECVDFELTPQQSRRGAAEALSLIHI